MKRYTKFQSGADYAYVRVRDLGEIIRFYTQIFVHLKLILQLISLLLFRFLNLNLLNSYDMLCYQILYPILKF